MNCKRLVQFKEKPMNIKTNFENINTVERSTRFAVAIAIVLFAMSSSLAGGTVAFVSLVGISMVSANLAIIGWCPFVALINKLKSANNNSRHGSHFPQGQHA